MTEKGKSKASTLPSANWLALRKKLSKSSPASTQHKHHHARKRRKLDHASSSPERTVSPSPHQAHTHAAEPSAFPRGRSLEAEQSAEVMMDMADEVKNGESLLQLRKMVLGQIHHTPAHTQPGKYVAIDCEMVGVGIDGEESALARVSLVNFYGAVLLDAFVRPRERVVDYRTQYSGIRPSDMVHAKSFEEVQKQVADLLEDRILVGHAVHNDLKALLLSHPRPLTRDTQSLSHKHKLPSARGRRPALRHLVQSELGLTIQSGEHSSVTDARATMALFRLHRKEWEKDFRPAVAAVLARARSRSRSKSPARAAAAASASVPLKRARRSSSPSASVAPDSDEDDAAVQPAAKKPKSKAGSKRKSSASSQNEDTFPGGGRRGVSSGLSTVIKRAGGAGSRSASAADKTKPKTKTKEKWWKDLGGGGSSGGSKGSMRLKVGR
ncbi:ribonuclease H-like protein [Trametes coccinea BRFM310]|uniref:RNA exonuclease 4 n=1 Tax=Trametes coccinea (strain BRFM310) TaxID=1353009 RepID=A0A1Y2IP95_TRAC3|nr:ribonuclease H-like protein [Trametes coccinea BRFM310]